MIGKRQRALVDRALAKLDLAPESFARMLKVAGVAKLDDLEKKSFDLFMDQCTVLNFRDPGRPILSPHTLKMIDELFKGTETSDFERASIIRLNGGCAEVRDLDGMGLIRLLVVLEKRDAPINGFIECRRSVTAKQLGLLGVARKEVGLEENTYSGLLQWYGGVNTASHLDQRGFDLIMAYLRFRGFGDARPVASALAGLADRPGFASPAQLGLIRELWAEWSGSADEAGLPTWLEHSYRVSALRFLPAATASAAITALKAMKRRKAAPAKGTA